MPRNIDKLFAQARLPGPGAGLLDAVMEAVTRERRHSLFFRRLPLLGTGLALSGAAAAYAVTLTVNEAARSGLVGFLSMFVTDTGSMMASWQDYLLSLLEALPIAPLAGVCGALFIFFALLRRLDDVIARSHRLHLI